MGKMAGAGTKRRGGCRGRIIERRLETGQLRVRQSVKKGLKNNRSLAKTGIQVIMNAIQ